MQQQLEDGNKQTQTNNTSRVLYEQTTAVFPPDD